MLANAPADRAWRRRGVLIMCRAFAESTEGEKGTAGKVKPGRGRGRGGGGRSAGGGQERANVLTRGVELETSVFSRKIVGFLLFAPLPARRATMCVCVCFIFIFPLFFLPSSPLVPIPSSTMTS